MGRLGWCVVLCAGLGCTGRDDGSSNDSSQPVFAVGSRAPLTGGTLIAAPTGEMAYASFPDLDSVARVDLWAGTIELLPLGAGAEPGRLVLDAQGVLHVVQRGTGEIADVDVSGRTLKLIGTRSVCAEPRGITADADRLHVACVGGDLVTLAAPAGGPVLSRTFIERDLRDVVVVNGTLKVSTFRSAQLLGVDTPSRIVPPTLKVPDTEVFPSAPRTFAPGVAWRTVATPNGSTVTTYTRGLVEAVSPVVPASVAQTCSMTSTSAYSGTTTTTTVACPEPASECDDTITAISHSAVMVVAPNGVVRSHMFAGALPVDVAVSPIDGSIVVAMAGSSTVAKVGTQVEDGELFPQGLPSVCAKTGSLLQPLFHADPDLVLAVAFMANGDLLVQTERSVVRVLGGGATVMRIDLGEANAQIAQRNELGYQLFHREATPGGIACATCHPDGLEDGRIWSLPEGVRRTQSLSGGAIAVAPFHWDGSLPSIPDLMGEVFVKRMGGTLPADPEVLNQLVFWLGGRRAPKSDAPSWAAGKALFEGRAGCSECHLGPRLSNDALADVGTGGLFKVPSLIGVGARFPLMHTGCATTFSDRFDPNCGGARHGAVTLPQTQDVNDLTAYLSSL
jgi:hypothetical protein